MEIIDLAEKRKAFALPHERYTNPQKEAIKLRPLWNFYKPLSRSKEMQGARNLYKQASKLIEKVEEVENVSRMINKGLVLNPKFHALYALKGDICMRQGKLMKAVKSYESARSTARFDFKLTGAETKIMYNKQLVAAYTKRGDWYYENGMLLEAVSDYEQVFLLRLGGTLLTDVQDKLLELLRKLEKYEMFRRYWDEFLVDANPGRTSVLLSMHAEYKIHLKEMAIARHMLFKALNLDKENIQAQELLQVVYDTGHTLTAYTVIWCMHGCYDKALMTIEKALDCNPYNPGFTLLKTIVLRLSGRFKEATSWLENVSKNFYKLLEPSADTQQSIMGNLSIDESRNELIKQWYLIRYDMAMKCMLNDKLEQAVHIICESHLTKYYPEPYMLLGDGFLKSENIDLALESYLKCREKMRELQLPASRKTIDVTERITDILNDRTKMAISKGRSKEAINTADKVLQILDEDQTELHQLGIQRGRALLYKARGLFQTAKKRNEENKQCCKIAADSLRFIREPEDADLYRTLYGERGIEDIIDRFAPKRKLPRSLKLLMQFS